VSTNAQFWGLISETISRACLDGFAKLVQSISQNRFI